MGSVLFFQAQAYITPNPGHFRSVWKKRQVGRRAIKQICQQEISPLRHPPLSHGTGVSGRNYECNNLGIVTLMPLPGIGASLRNMPITPGDPTAA